MGPGSRIFMDFPHKPSSALYASASIWIGQTLINIRIHWNTLESLEHIASESEFVLPSYAFVVRDSNGNLSESSRADRDLGFRQIKANVSLQSSQAV